MKDKLTSPLLSVIIPCYNVEKYISKCLDSVIELKEYIANMEIIIINDASNDKTEKFLNYYHYFNYIKIIHLETNHGLGKARNIGLKLAKGKFIFFLDSDDSIDPFNLNNAVKHIDQFDLNVLYINHCNYDFDQKMIIHNNERDVFFQHQNKMAINTETLLKPQNYLLHVAWNKLYKRKFLLQNNFLFSEGYYEDIPWNIDLLLTIPKVNIYNNRVCYFYTQRNNSILKNRNSSHLSLIHQYEIVLNSSSYQRASNSEKIIINTRCANHLIAFIAVNMSHRLNLRDNFKFIKNTSSLLSTFKVEENLLDSKLKVIFLKLLNINNFFSHIFILLVSKISNTIHFLFYKRKSIKSNQSLGNPPEK